MSTAEREGETETIRIAAIETLRIARSKIILDLRTHANENEDQKHARIFYALINNKCVVSQKMNENFYGDLIVCTEDLLHTIAILLHSGDWKEIATRASEGYRELCERNLSSDSRAQD